MTTTAWADARTCFRRAHAADPRPDGELLHLFAAGRDESAFASLVHRHGPLVWGVAVRHAGDRHAAEDAFQATFFALARLAGSLRTDAPLAGWLHTVARRLAGRARRLAPQPIPVEPATAADPLAVLTARERVAALDDEIDRLPDRYRLPVILCCLDGLTRDEAADRLGWPVGSVKGRLERGREALRRRLSKRGIDLPAAVAAATTVSTLPAALADATPPAAVAFAATGGGGPAAALAAGVGGSSLRKVWVGALTAACAVVAVGTGWTVTTAPADLPQKPTADAPRSAPADGDADTIPVRVQFAAKPVAGAKVWAFVEWYSDGKTPAPPASAPVLTDVSGVARLPLEQVQAFKTSWVLFARDAAGRIGTTTYHLYDRTPSASAIALRETTTLIGRVTGADGQPLAGIRASAGTFQTPTENGYQNRLVFPPWEVEANRVRTDADGRFAIPGVPVGLNAWVYLSGDGYGDLRGMVPNDKPLSLTLRPVGTIRVTFRGADPAGTKGLKFMTRRQPTKDETPALLSFREGQFDGSPAHIIRDLSPGSHTLEAYGGGAIPVIANSAVVEVKSGGMTDIVLALAPLAKATGRVVEAETGKPIPDARVEVRPRTYEKDYPHGTVKTDADGRYTYFAPPGFTVIAGVYPPTGYLHTDYRRDEQPNLKLTAAGLTFPDIKLPKATTFTATVVDAAGNPVSAVVYPSFIPNVDRIAPAGKDGVVRVPGVDPNDMIALRVRRGDAVNVPAAVDVSGDGKTVITVTTENAVRIAGRVTDAAGKPVPNAKVGLHWMVWGVGKSASGGTATTFETLTTDAEGRYRSSALWPTDEYWVTVKADGFGDAESAHVRKAEAKPHTLDVKLANADLAVAGVVVDLAGTPVAGATVFNRGDGDKPMTATADAAGRFALRGYRAGPAFVFAKMAGHRLAVAPADPGGGPVTLTLRKLTDPPVPPPDMTAHTAAVDALARRTLELLWANREVIGGFERTVFDDAMRFDRAMAAKWAADVKGSKTDFAARLKRDEQDAKLAEVAKADPDEAVALLADRTGRDGYYAVVGLARKLRPTAPKAAARLVEDAVQRARATDMPERAMRLAEAGYLAARCGNAAAGKALTAEAATLAEPLRKDDRVGFYRGWVAGYLAPFDRDRAVKMIADFPKAGDHDRYLAHAIDRVAAFDVAAAAGLLDGFRAGGTFDRQEGRMFLAYRVAATDVDRAQKLIAGVTDEHYRTLGYLKLAQVVARTDKPRAWKILDAALAEYDGEVPEFDSWMSSGGRAGVLAVVAAGGREIGYPDVSGAVARALAVRPVTESFAPQRRSDQAVNVALALAFVDPAAARRVLRSVLPADEFVTKATTGQREWLFAAAFVLPEAAGPAVDARMKTFRSGQSGLIELADALAAADRLAATARWGGMPKVNNEWEE